MNRPVHFEIHVENAERAIKFYTDVFGWEITKFDGLDQPYWMVMTAPKDSKEQGINGGMLLRQAPLSKDQCATNGFVCTMQVENIDATIAKIEKAGGTLAMPKFALLGMAWQAYYKDTEGNVIGIHQADKNAK